MISNKHRRTARGLNIALTTIGLLVFGALWLMVLLQPDMLMDKAQDFAVERAETALEDSFISIEELYGNTALGRRALDFARERSPDAEGRLQALRDTLGTPEMDALKTQATEAILVMANRIPEADMTVPSDGKSITREGVAAYLEGVSNRLEFNLDVAKDRVTERFDSVMDSLRLDILIFSGTTAAAFAFALLLSVFKGAQAMRHLLPISLIMSGATLFAAYWYVFEQNWAMTVLTSGFWGWSYLTFIVAVFVLLFDITLNRARIIRAALRHM